MRRVRLRWSDEPSGSRWHRSVDINHLTEHGVMGAALLYESPFTDIAPHGPDDLFTSEEVDRLVAVLDRVRAAAEAA
jgi:type I restriction enzyme R subunit